MIFYKLHMLNNDCWINNNADSNLFNGIEKRINRVCYSGFEKGKILGPGELLILNFPDQTYPIT